MQRVPPALLASYRALYVVLRGDAADAEEDINRYACEHFVCGCLCVCGGGLNAILVTLPQFGGS